MAREEWLKRRLKGIGASEASAIVGMNPYKTNVELWEEKTGRREPEDISEKPYVKYGTEAEKHLRELFALDYPEIEVSYKDFDVRYNPEYPFIFATLDGDLTDGNRKGVLEIKTANIMNATQYGNWKNQIPQNYFIQVVHQLLATEYDFAIVKAQLKWNCGDRTETQHYRIEREEVLEDIDYLLQREILFWECVEQDRKPNLILPAI